MDFFAQAYNRPSASDNTAESKVSPGQSPRTSHACEGVGLGYGCEANAHLRRASFGLECDVGLRSFAASPYHNQHSHNQATPKQDRGGIGSPATKTTHQGQNKDLHISTSSPSPSHDVYSSLRSSPLPYTLHRRTSVSNPCLLHHTNLNGGGAVRTPVMPQSLTSPRIVDGSGQQDHSYFHSREASDVREPTIEEGREHL